MQRSSARVELLAHVGLEAEQIGHGFVARAGLGGGLSRWLRVAGGDLGGQVSFQRAHALQGLLPRAGGQGLVVLAVGLGLGHALVEAAHDAADFWV